MVVSYLSHPSSPSSSSCSSSSLVSKRKSHRRFKVEKVHLCGVWLWGEINDRELTCVICDNAFEMPCTECTHPGDSCPPAYGACAHVFHLHCIGRWLNRLGANREEQATCPMCRQTWQFVTDNSKKQTSNNDNNSGINDNADCNNRDTPANNASVNMIEGGLSSSSIPPSYSSASSSSSSVGTSVSIHTEEEGSNVAFSSHPHRMFSHSNFARDMYVMGSEADATNINNSDGVGLSSNAMTRPNSSFHGDNQRVSQTSIEDNQISDDTNNHTSNSTHNNDRNSFLN